MAEVRLPFGSIFVCKICGYASDAQTIKEVCDSSPIQETTSFKVGDVVKKYDRAWQGNRLTGMLSQPSEFTIIRLYYAQPYHLSVGSGGLTKKPRIHELCITLAQSWDNINEPGVWKPGDNGMSFETLTFSDFLLWQKGNRRELEKIGYVKPPLSATKTFLANLKELLPFR